MVDFPFGFALKPARSIDMLLGKLRRNRDWTIRSAQEVALRLRSQTDPQLVVGRLVRAAPFELALTALTALRNGATMIAQATARNRNLLSLGCPRRAPSDVL